MTDEEFLEQLRQRFRDGPLPLVELPKSEGEVPDYIMTKFVRLRFVSDGKVRFYLDDKRHAMSSAGPHVHELRHYIEMFFRTYVS